MSTAEELLAATQEDGVLTVDNDLRTISIPSGYEILGVESDDDVNRIHFRGPRYYHGVDLSLFDIRVNIETPNGDLDMFPVTDVAVDDAADAITFSWLIGRYTAQYEGTVTFSLCFREINQDGVITREFNTTTATGKILEGLETGDVIIQQNPDVLENILLRLDSLENGQVLGNEYVTSVNGIKPDSTGNVTIEVGSADGTVKTVNGIEPDMFGNVSIEIPTSIDEIIKAMPTTTSIDFTNWTNGSFTETLSDGTTNVYEVILDETGAPTSIGGIIITGVSDLG